ncbi:hypothetical protein O3G_MSEX006221 [Manduca sexta]|uniref:Structure-specific endonuclease subunit SLX1 homolog n=1 Tax=Manduca sexta TaxID=7130 RepID=A0A922CK09_MANSE|nr:hypothetical protein O3G_MSEX006221 [Manduca sexta]
MTEPELVEDFFGVYLLYCLNPKYKGRTYIGYTRDPNRRIMQHNRGTWAGGAHRTNNKGPWKMVLIVHGFPNNISALRFEWAWQNPTKTIRLQHLNLIKIPRKETEYKFKLRVLSEMLRVGPWYRLPLSVRWLETEYIEEFLIERKPPDHMVICQGPIKSKNLKKSTKCIELKNEECLLCSKYIADSQTRITCLNSTCKLKSHITCLADLFLSPGEYIPVRDDDMSDLDRMSEEDIVLGDNMSDDDKVSEVDISDDDIVADVDTAPKADTLKKSYEKNTDDYPSWFDDCEDL